MRSFMRSWAMRAIFIFDATIGRDPAPGRPKPGQPPWGAATRAAVELRLASEGGRAQGDHCSFMALAMVLPSSTPHWSNALMRQMAAWVNTLCS